MFFFRSSGVSAVSSRRNGTQLNWAFGTRHTVELGFGTNNFVDQKLNLLPYYGTINHISELRKELKKCAIYLYHNLTNKRQAFTTALRLPTAISRINQEKSK